MSSLLGVYSGIWEVTILLNWKQDQKALPGTSCVKKTSKLERSTQVCSEHSLSSWKIVVLFIGEDRNNLLPSTSTVRRGLGTKTGVRCGASNRCQDQFLRAVRFKKFFRVFHRVTIFRDFLRHSSVLLFFVDYPDFSVFQSIWRAAWFIMTRTMAMSSFPPFSFLKFSGLGKAWLRTEHVLFHRFWCI